MNHNLFLPSFSPARYYFKVDRAKARLKSFTLLEALLIIIIISILLGIALPSINKNIKNIRFKSFVKKVYLFLDYAKNQSIFKNKILEAKFNLDGTTINLMAKDNQSKLFKIDIPENIYLSADKEKVLFYPDGTLQEFKVIIYNNGGKASTISSKGFDGKIRVGKKEKI